MSKRGESIWKRKDGRWEGRYIIDRTPEGKAIYASVYAKTYSEVKEKKRNAIISNENKQKLPQENCIYINCLIDNFLNYHRQFLKESSLSRYYEITHKYISSQLGKIKTCEMDQNMVDKFIDWLRNYEKKNGGLLSVKTIQDIISVFKLVIKYAESKNYMKPISLIYNIPKQQRKKIKVFDNHQREKLEQFVCSNSDTYKFGVYLCLYTGLRIGEVCALKWEDIDCLNSYLKINKTVLRITNIDDSSDSKTSVIINTPKTPSSIRIIPLPDVLMQMMKKLKSEKDNSVYLLTGSKNFIEPRIYYERYKRYLKACDLEGYTFHTLRHTFATRCVESGIDPKALSEILGHSSVRLTLDRYVHPSIDNKRQCLERLFAQ